MKRIGVLLFIVLLSVGSQAGQSFSDSFFEFAETTRIFYSLIEKKLGLDQKRIISPEEQRHNELAREFVQYLGDQTLDLAADNIPSVVTIGFDMYLTWSLKYLSKELAVKGRGILPKEIQSAYELVATFEETKDQTLKQRAQAALDSLRNFNDDVDLRSCFYVRVIQNDNISNAYTTGCSINLTSRIVKVLPKDQLLAVIAHEMSHGDKGHPVRNIGIFLRKSVVHVKDIIRDDLRFIFKGQISPLLKAVIKDSHFSVLVDAYGKEAPAIELEADRGGAQILCRAGYDPESLKQALVMLSFAENQEVATNFDDLDDYRDYPGLGKRVQVIDQVRQECSLKPQP